MLGISIYLGQQKESEQYEYLLKMKKAGFSSVFTSLHIPEDNQDLYKGQLKVLGKQAKLLGLELMIDISPKSFKALDLSYETIYRIREWGITGLRVDYGISEDVIVSLSKKIKIALNASTLNEDFIKNLITLGLKVEHVEAWHNYYPRKETGLAVDTFLLKNKLLQQYGITVMAFIPGDGDLRGPIFETLPTLEKHRHTSPFKAFLDMKNYYVDKILIGDKSLLAESLNQFEEYNNGSIPLRCEIYEKDDLIRQKILQQHRNRLDPARDVIRSETSRLYANNGDIIEPNNTVGRSIGSITLDNKKYGRYSGELQIALCNLEKDERVNVVGKVVDSDIELLSYISAGQRFHFTTIKD